jgi:hypothetical protein
MTDISDNNITNAVFDADSDFLLRYLNTNLINPMGANNNNMRDSITNIINDLERDISNSMVFPRNRRRSSRLSRRPEMGNINPLFNHVIPSTQRDISNNDYTDFISQLFRTPVPYNRPRHNINSILQSSLMDPSQDMYKKVLSDEGEKDIKTVVFKVGEFPNDCCPMTLNNFSDGDKVSQLPCGHIFEPEAIIKWLKKENASCPVCRKPLQSKEIKKNLFNQIRDSSSNRLVGSTRRRSRPRLARNVILNFMERQIQQEEEEELQAAIMESLRMSTENADKSKND